MNLIQQLESTVSSGIAGSVVRTEGMSVAVACFPAAVGSLVKIEKQCGSRISGEVIGFRDRETIVFPHEDVTGVRRGNRVHLARSSRFLPVGEAMLGRVVNAQGQVVDERPKPWLPDRVPLHRSPPPATQRPRIDQPLSTGIRAIDGLLTCGIGQRVGIFSGSGVGKSVTMGMTARYTSADVNVIALIGERGREVNEFIEKDLGEEGRKRSVVVVATGDEPAVLRVQAAFAATAIAEYFRDRGQNVLLMMDSLTRFAMAQREIGLHAGEPATSRGYTPSVFALLPRLVERAGRTPAGSITAVYSVLVEGDDTNEPISDAVRGLLDGHIMLSRDLASRGHYPAIDILSSISRLITELASPEQLAAAQTVRQLLAAYRDHADLISIGAYRNGSNPVVDVAIKLKAALEQFLCQSIGQSSSVAQARQQLMEFAKQAEALLRSTAGTAGEGNNG